MENIIDKFSLVLSMTMPENILLIFASGSNIKVSKLSQGSPPTREKKTYGIFYLCPDPIQPGRESLKV